MNISTKEYTSFQSEHINRGNEEDIFIELTTPVADNRPVFIVGSFNDWRIDEEKYRLTKISATQFFYKFSTEQLQTDRIEYKFIRGGWENQELDEFSNPIHNRVLDKNQRVIRIEVPRWKNYGLAYNPKYLPKIEVVDKEFYIPQLNKYRRVAAIVPHDYHKTGDKKYQVIYMNDAQNLFGESSPYGNWGIDKKLAVLAEQGKGDVIIIAIDHGGAERTTEFIPVDTQRFGTSAGRKYIDFITKTLKPAIDRRFRTLTSREHTGIGGSSLGGLISIYAGLIYPDVFGKLIIMSPSLWVTRHFPMNNISFFQPIPTKIYAYAGGEESATMVPNIYKFIDAINQQGFDSSIIKIQLNIDPKGTHTEKRWGEEFPRAIEWILE